MLSSDQEITSIGKVMFSKTVFKNKETGERRYLLDEMLQFDPHERITLSNPTVNLRRPLAQKLLKKESKCAIY